MKTLSVFVKEKKNMCHFEIFPNRLKFKIHLIMCLLKYKNLNNIRRKTKQNKMYIILAKDD